MSIKDKILNAQDYKTKEVHVPELDLEVTVKGLSVTGFTAFQKALVQDDDPDSLKSFIQAVIFGVIDEDGSQAFTQKDVKKLSEKSPAVIMRLGAEIIELTGAEMSDEDIEKK